MRFLLAILLLLFVAPASAQQGQGMSKAMVVSSCGGGALPSGSEPADDGYDRAALPKRHRLKCMLAGDSLPGAHDRR